MAALPIRWIEARVHAHATEDEGRVAAALDAACPGGPATREVAEGHFGNPIVRLTRRIDAPGAIRAVWSRWSAAGLFEAIDSELDARVADDGILHVRFDKQAAYAGSVTLAKGADSIDVRVRLQAYPAKAEAFRALARALVTGGP